MEPSEANVLVVITCRNYEQYLEAAVESVNTQTYHCSVITFHDYCGTSFPKGVARNRNQVLDFTNSFLNCYDYLIFLDADDILPSNYVEELLKASRGEEVIVACGMELFGDLTGFHNVRTPITSETILEQNTIHVSALIPVKAFVASKGFADLDAYEDWELWFRLSHKYEFRNCATTRLQHRVHSGSRHHNKKIGLDDFRNKLVLQTVGTK